MTKSKITDILNGFKDGSIDIDTAIASLKNKKENISEKDMFARIDHSRSERCGFPEFVYGEGKTVTQLKSIIKEITSKNNPLLITRLSEDTYKKLKKNFPQANYDPRSKTFIIKPKAEKQHSTPGKVAIVTAGTTDIPVALEAQYTAEVCGCTVDPLFDVGVAGIHRLLSNVERIRSADVIIVVAGMEGALPSVVAGLVSCPIIAVPTSVGYGASLGGLTAMFAMLNSCANGVVVTNIDNGFGAGCAAARIINSIKKSATCCK